MIICPNLNNPDVAREFNEIKNATSEAAAYHIWSLNNGNAIDKAPNGAQSKLFQDLLDLCDGDRTKAIQAKAKVYGNGFVNWFGDWVNDPANASKVIDGNGEPLVVYHGTLGEFSVFDFNRLGEVTGQGYYTDHITGERIPIDSSSAFFFTDNKIAAQSYKNLAIYNQNNFREAIYRNLASVFLNNPYIKSSREFDEKQKEAQIDFIDNVLSPYLGFNVREQANKIIDGTSKLSDEKKKELGDKFKEMAHKIRELPDARSVSNQENSIEIHKKELEFLKANKQALLTGEDIPYFKHSTMHVSSGYGNWAKGEIYITIGRDKETNKYYVVGIPNSSDKIEPGTQDITDENFNTIIEYWENGIKQNTESLNNDKKLGHYNRGNVLPVFLNIKNPLEHDYNSSSFPDKYLVNAKEGDEHAAYYGGEETLKRPLLINGKEVPTAYVAARQVRKAKKDGNDGVIYKNVHDPFGMTSFGIFGANQIKSATDNNGQFSTQNDDIRFHKSSGNSALFRDSNTDRQKRLIIYTHYCNKVHTQYVTQVTAMISIAKSIVQHNINNCVNAFYDGQNDTEDQKYYNVAQREKEIKQILSSYGVEDYIYQVKRTRIGNGGIKVYVTISTINDAVAHLNEEVADFVKGLQSSELDGMLGSIFYSINDGEDATSKDALLYIKPKDQQEITNRLQRSLIERYEFYEDVFDDTMEYLQSLPNDSENNLFVKVAIKWLKTSIISKDQLEYLKDIFKQARKKNYDVQKFKTHADLISWFFEENKKSIKEGGTVDAGSYPGVTFNKRVTNSNGNVIEIYDVTDDQIGQQSVCEILGHTTPLVNSKPFAFSPWCVSTYHIGSDGKITPTEGAVNTYWPMYRAANRQIAMFNGRPIAFNSSSHKYEEWWDFNDRPHDSILEVDENLRLNSEKLLYKMQIQDDFMRDIRVGNYFFRKDSASYIRVDDTQSFRVVFLANSDTVHSVQINHYGNQLRICIMYNENRRIPIDVDLINRGEFFMPGNRHNVFTRSIIDNIRKYLYSNVGDSYSRPFSDLQQILSSKQLDLLKDIKKDLQSACKYIQDHIGELVHNGIVNSQLLAQISDDIKALSYRIDQFIDFNIKLNARPEQKVDPAIQTGKSDVLDIRDFDPGYDVNGENQQNAPTNTDNNYPQDEADNNENQQRIPITINTDYLYDDRVVDSAIAGIYDRQYLKHLYDFGIITPVNEDLEKHLRKILKKFHFEIFDDDIITEVFGDDVLGAADFIQKVIYLSTAKNRNSIVMPEEFCHAFIKIMGAAYHRVENRDKYPETKLYGELRDLIMKTELYDQVYQEYAAQYRFPNGAPNVPAIAEEALGKALAAVLSYKMRDFVVRDVKIMSFLQKLKDWFNKVLDWFKGKVYRYRITEGIVLEDELNNIADSILDGSYFKKYLKKINDKGYKRMRYEDSIKLAKQLDGGKAYKLLRFLSTDCGGLITGSLSYRYQGTVYRKTVEALHDIDVVFHSSQFNHQYYFYDTPENLIAKINDEPIIDRIKQEFPDFKVIGAFVSNNNLVVNSMVCGDQSLYERFCNMNGDFNSRLARFTEEERKKIYLIDIFANQDIRATQNPIYDEENDIRLAHYSASFREKLRFSRAKDLYDYQNFKPEQRIYPEQYRQIKNMQKSDSMIQRLKQLGIELMKRCE